MSTAMTMLATAVMAMTMGCVHSPSSPMLKEMPSFKTVLNPKKPGMTMVTAAFSPMTAKATALVIWSAASSTKNTMPSSSRSFFVTFIELSLCVVFVHQP